VTGAVSLLRCPVCGAAIPAGPRCDFCLVALRLEQGALAAAHPVIRPGDVLTTLDFARDPLPGEKQRVWSRLDGAAATAEASGVTVHVPPLDSRIFVLDWVRVRDACVRASLASLDGRVQPGIMLRREPIGDGARTFYALDVWPERRSVRLARCFSTKEESGATPLFGWAEAACVAPLGQENQIELRAQGATLEAWVNGARVTTVHDPVLGIGWTGIRAMPVDVRPGERVRMFCRGFEVRGVAS
jgi:hypothetical protein